MDKLLDKQTTHTCTFCNEPLTLLELGPDKFRLWVHRGESLRICEKVMSNLGRSGSAIQTEGSFVQILLARMKQFKWKFGRKYVDGRGKMHGE